MTISSDQSIWTFSQHRLDVIRDIEGCLRLGLDLLYCDAVGEFDEGESVGEVDVKDTLLLLVVS